MKSLVVNIISALLAIVVLNAVAFLPPLAHTDSFWVSYGCGWVVIVLSFAVSAIASMGAQQGNRVVYGIPFYIAASLYLVVGAVFNLVCMIVPNMLVWVVVLVNVILAVLLIAMFVTSGVTRDYLEGQDQKTKADTSFMVALRNQTENLLAAAANTSVEKDARALRDVARFSDPVSSPDSLSSESCIMGLVVRAIQEVNALEEETARSTIAQAMSELEQRNRLLKSYK